MSQVYASLVAARRFLYSTGIWKSEKVAVPVIVIGNVVAGGAGKTPLVIAIVRHLQSLGHRVGVVSRGYLGNQVHGSREVLPTSAASDLGDEAVLVSRATLAPVFVGRRRADAANSLLRAHPDVTVLVADDGLQHLALRRDIEICVFDQSGIGNGLLLPAGPLREAWPRPVDLVVAPGPVAGATPWKVRRRLGVQARRADGREMPLADLAALAASAGRQLCAVAGIARPETFFGMLRDAGVPLAGSLALQDHARFDAADWPAADTRMLVCTEKDAVKLWQFRPDAWSVPLELELEPGFWASLQRLLQQRAGAKLSSDDGHTTA